jgi:hypothetical protein
MFFKVFCSNARCTSYQPFELKHSHLHLLSTLQNIYLVAAEPFKTAFEKYANITYSQHFLFFETCVTIHYAGMACQGQTL